MIVNPTDQELLARMAEADPEAMSVLYDRYASRVKGLCFKILGDGELAEEVMQDVFWQVWKKAASFKKSSGTFQSWLFAIARNKAIDVWRRKIRSIPVEQEELAQWADSNPAPEEIISLDDSATFTKQSVEEALLQLSAEQRAIIDLAYFEGKTRREIASEQDIPLGTVHTRARLALGKLRNYLVERGVEA